MSNQDSTPEISSTLTPSPAHYPTLLDLRALQQRNNALLQEAPRLRRTEVGELLHRHYQDKSLIDEWTSWCYDLSFWQKSSMSISIISIAGLSGAVIGLAFPFIAIASSILYAAYKLLNEHEQHRRDRGERFAAETTELTDQLDSMMNQFRLIATEMTTALEKVKIQAVEMSEHNTEIKERTREHQDEQEKLQGIIAGVSEQAERAQNVQNDVIAVVEEIRSGLLLIPAHIDNATRAVDDFKESIDQFAETTALMHHTETNLVEISNGLKDCVQRISTAQPKQAAQPDPEFDDAIQRSQRAILQARARRAELINVEEGQRFIM